MTKQIFIETSNENTNEYKFVEYLCKKLGVIEPKILCVGGKDKLEGRQELVENDVQNIILFDADNDIKESRENILKQLNGIEADILTLSQKVCKLEIT